MYHTTRGEDKVDKNGTVLSVIFAIGVTMHNLAAICRVLDGIVPRWFVT
jgi:hypothetical protein